MFEYTFNVTCFHRVIDIHCMCLYLVHQTLIILFSVAIGSLDSVSRSSTKHDLAQANCFILN
jgi:hypothetical protein